METLKKNINYFGVGGFLKSLGKETSPKIAESVVSKEVKNLLDQALEIDLAKNAFPSGFSPNKYQLLRQYRKTYLDAKLGDSDFVSTADKLAKDVKRTFGTNSKAVNYIYAPISEDVRKLFVKNNINNLPDIQSKIQKTAQELNDSAGFEGILGRKIKNIDKDSHITIFKKPVTIGQLRKDIYKRYTKEFEDLSGISLPPEQARALIDATPRGRDIWELEKAMSEFDSKNYTIYGAVSYQPFGDDFSGFILGTTKLDKDNPAIKLMQEQINSLRGSTISGEELSKLEDAVVNSVPKNRTYLYHSDNKYSNIDGYYAPDTGLSFINLRTMLPENLESTLIHESLSHATDEVLPKKVVKSYQDALGQMKLTPTHAAESSNWQELRATLTQLKNKLAPDGNIETLKKAVNDLKPEELATKLMDTNAYGMDYGEHLLGAEKSAAVLKKAILTLPVAALAVLLGTQVDNGQSAIKAQEGAKLPETFVIPETIELDYDEPEFIFRHLPNEYIAQDLDNDLKSYYYQGRIKYGQLDEDAIQELQREYNLDKTQLQETFNDLFNAGYGESLVKDLENKPVTTEEVEEYKEGGRLIPKAMSGKVLEEAENILQFNRLDLAQNIPKKQLLLAKRLLGFVSGKATQSTGRKLNSVLNDGKLTQKQLLAIGNLNYGNKAIRKALKSKKALSDQELAALANTRQGKALINKFKESNFFKRDLENGINSKTFSDSTRNNILNEQDSLALAAETIPISNAIKYAGEKALPSKKLVECLQDSAKNTGSSRVQLLSDSLEEAYNKGIYLPQTYLDYVAGILKTSKVKKGSDISQYSLKALTKDSLKSSSINDDLDQAIASLQEIADGNFTVNQKILEKVYTTKGGAVVKNPLEAANTKLERKYFTDKEWSRAMEEQMGDVSKIEDLTTEEINAFFDSGIIPDRFKTPYHTNIPEALQKYYDHSNSNIYDMRVKKKYVEQVVKELKKNNPNLEGEIKITPITDDDPVTVLVTGANGELKKKPLEGYKHLVGYNFTIGGQEILPELRTTLEQHHGRPLGIIQGTNTINNSEINNARELLNTRLKQTTVNPEYLLLTKPFHTGVEGIHYNDKWTPQDISRQKELAFTHAFKSMDEVEKFYTKVSRKRYANLLSKGDKNKALQLEQEMIEDPSKLQEYQQKYLTIKRKEFVKKLDKDTKNKIEDWRKFREDNNLTTEEFVEMAKEYPKEFPGFSKILKGFDSDEELLAANVLKHGGNIQYFK